MSPTSKPPYLELNNNLLSLFLYTLDLSETDFLNLKNEQSILVDFQAFPSKLIEMFELCLSSSGSTSERLKYILITYR